MENISSDQLKIMVQTIKRIYHDKNEDFYKMRLSIDLLRIYLGNDWVNITVFNKNLDNYMKHLGAREFLRSSSNGFQWKERVRRLAERLYNLQKIKNMDRIIEDIKQGNFESRFAEIEGATHIYRSDIFFEFVKPINQKRQDFDIRILTNPKINCEVKHKLENIKRDKKTIVKSIKKTLRKAREQVPLNEPSLFIIKIPEEWDKKDPYIINGLEEFFKEKDSENVVAIILRWEQRNKNNEGIFGWKYFLKKNEYFSMKGKKIEIILDSLNNPSYKNWTNFDLIF